MTSHFMRNFPHLVLTRKWVIGLLLNVLVSYGVSYIQSMRSLMRELPTSWMSQIYIEFMISLTSELLGQKVN
jgi:hypothetical protein